MEPRDVCGLAYAISSLIKDRTTRKTLILGGLRLARENTLDARAEELVREIRKRVSSLCD